MATIIKKQKRIQTTGKTLHAVAYDLADMSAQAENYVGGVRVEATRIVQAAKQEAAAIRKQAEIEGQKAAETAVNRLLDEKIAGQMQTLLPAVKAVVTQIEDSKQQWLQHWEHSVVRLAAAIAEKLIRRELKENPELSLDWIKSALELAAGSAEVTVRLHPDDYETLRDEVARLADLICPIASAKVEPDESISAGGCRVDTQFGTIDQQVEARLARAVQEML